MSQTALLRSILTVACVCLAATKSAAADADLSGEWAGWGYEEASDFPLRAGIDAGDGRTPPQAWVALPHQGGARAETAVVELDAEHFVLAQNDGESEWRWSARLAGGVLAGELTHDGKRSARFELVRCPEPLIRVARGRLAPCIGAYRSESGAVVVVSAWSWGELRLADLSSGAVRTLFSVDEESFYTGPAEYVPAPIESRVHVEVDDDGAVRALRISRDDHPAETFSRCSFTEEPVDWTVGDAHLVGTLVAPDDGKRHPAIILLEGSSWRTRGDARLDADAFAALGYAALAFDRRGCGGSSGDANCAFDDIATDAAAAAEMLAERDDIDASRIGVFGRSRGGWLAPLAATKSDAIGFVVLFVAPAVSPEVQETTRRLNEMRAAGATEAQIARAARHLALLWKCADSDSDWQRYIADRREIEHEPWFGHVGDIDSKDSPERIWMQRNMRHDPIPVLEQLACPVLAFFGGSDSNVTPEQNLAPMRAALERGGNSSVKLVVVPGADHGLSTDAPDTLLHKRRGQAAEVWPTISEWIAALPHDS